MAMHPRTTLLMLFALALLAGMGSAEAKIYIPCTGDRLVKILDVPALKGKGPDNADVSLGYKFSGCFGDGEWIGYIDSRNFVQLDDARLKTVLAAAGLKAAPPEPSRWQHPLDALLIEILTAGVLVLVLAWSYLGPLVKRLRGAP